MIIILKNLVQEEFYHKTWTSVKISEIIIRQREGIQISILFSSALKKLLICGGHEVSHYSAEFKWLKCLLSPNLCIRPH